MTEGEVYEIAQKIADKTCESLSLEFQDEIRRLEIEIENLRSEFEEEK